MKITSIFNQTPNCVIRKNIHGVSSTRYLGSTMDTILRWKVHVGKIVSRLSTVTYHRCYKFNAILRTIYFALRTTCWCGRDWPKMQFNPSPTHLADKNANKEWKYCVKLNINVIWSGHFTQTIFYWSFE